MVCLRGEEVEEGCLCVWVELEWGEVLVGKSCPRGCDAAEYLFLFVDEVVAQSSELGVVVKVQEVCHRVCGLLW